MSEDKLTSESSEESFLSLILNNPKKLDDLRISEDLFSDDTNKAVYLTASSLRLSGKQISRINIGIESGDGVVEGKAAKMLARTMASGDFEHLHGHLQNLSLRRKAAGYCKEGYNDCYNMEQPIDSMLDSLEKDVLGIRGSSQTGMKDGNDMRGVIASLKWKREHPGKVRGLRFGFKGSERLLDGFLGGQLYIVGARPSVGKTAILTSMILNGIQRRIVPAVFSLEMKGTLIQERLVAHLANVDLSISKEREFSQDELQRIDRAVGRLEQLSWYYKDTSRMDIDSLCSHSRRLKSEQDIDAIFVDYLQIIQNKRYQGEEPRLRVGENTFYLKQLADELDIPVIVAAQLRRKEGRFDNAKKKMVAATPELHDLKESGDIEQDADVVGLLNRNQIDNATWADIFWAKNRNGATGKINLLFSPETTSFREDEGQ